jgi:Zn-dependent protease
MESFFPVIQKMCLWALPILMAVILHEIAHGYVAFRLGDPTASQLGRLTLNPFAHMDPFGTVILPLLLLLGGSPFLFGYAKPVPVNFRNLRNPRRGMVLVALAGPVTNLLLAGFFALVYRFIPLLDSPEGNLLATNLLFFKKMAGVSVLMNVGLAVFNLIPLPPLDGGRVATGLLPRSSAIALARLEPYGMLIIMVLLASGALDHILHPMTKFLIQTLL